jgi:hypothetical protein
MDNSNDSLDPSASPTTVATTSAPARAQASAGERGDYWTRTCGVPWERISKAVQAVGQRNLRSNTRAPRDGAS